MCLPQSNAWIVEIKLKSSCLFLDTMYRYHTSYVVLFLCYRTSATTRRFVLWGDVLLWQKMMCWLIILDLFSCNFNARQLDVRMLIFEKRFSKWSGGRPTVRWCTFFAFADAFWYLWHLYDSFTVTLNNFCSSLPRLSHDAWLDDVFFHSWLRSIANVSWRIS